MSTPITLFCGQCSTRVTSEMNHCGQCGAELLRPDLRSLPTDSYPEYVPRTVATDGTALPGEIAEMKSRTVAWLIVNVGTRIVGGIPVIGWIISIAAFVWTLMLYQRGQDIGARFTNIRVIRDTGELAGFYHMWTRSLASIISFFLLGAGFWTAYFNEDRQTWHDKWMGTYVVKASPEVDRLNATSSHTAKTWFWLSILGVPASILIILFLALAL